jgi:hypothetical protein
MDQFLDLDDLTESGLTVSYLCNAIPPRIVGVINFREFIRFLQKGLNPFKI